MNQSLLSCVRGLERARQLTVDERVLGVVMWIRDGWAALCLGWAGLVAGQETPKDLIALVLIPADLKDATQLMTVYDPDEDGFIDAKEQRRLSWRDAVEQYDLNHDQKLTHLAIALVHYHPTNIDLQQPAEGKVPQSQ